MNVWEMMSVSSYALMTSFVESLIVCLFFVVVGALLPYHYFREKFVSHIFMIIATSTIWAVAAQFHYVVVYNWAFVERLPWIIAFFVSLLIVYGLIQFSDRQANVVMGIVRRISVLSTIYIALGIIGLLVVVIRNI